MNPPPLATPPVAPPVPVPVRRRGCGCSPVAVLAALVVLGLGGLVILLALVGAGLLVQRNGLAALKLPLVRREVVPDADHDQVVKHGDQIAVTVPFGTLDRKQTLAVSRMLAPPPPPAGHRLGTAYDVTLGDRHRFDDGLEIQVSLASLPGVEPRRLVALTYDAASGKWTEAPALLDRRTRQLRIFTTHLSGFAPSSAGGSSPEQHPMARVSSGARPAFSPVGSVEEAESILSGGTAYAAKAGWDYAMEQFGFGTNFFTLVEEVGQVQGLSRLNELAGNLGLGFAVLQLAIDLAEGEDVRGVMNATKSIGYYQLGTWGTSAMKIASVGVFAIDYSLNRFANEAVAGRYAIYERAYAAYYRDHRRTGADWYRKLKGILQGARDPDAAAAAMAGEIDTYASEFWQNEATVAEYQERVSGHAWTGGGGLNERVKAQISNNAKADLAPVLDNILARIKRELAYEQAGKVHDTMKQMAAALNRVYTIPVTVRADDPERSVKGLSVVIPVSRDQDLWRGETDADGKWTMRCTALGYLMYGAPKKIVLTIPNERGEPEQIEQELKLTGVLFDLEEAAGTYEGLLTGSHAAAGIDGTVRFEGPITIVVTKEGAATVRFELPVNFSGGGGLVGIKVNAKGNGTGTVKNGKLAATATVTSSYTQSSRVAAVNRSGTGGGSVTLEGTLTATGKTAQIRGTMRSPQGGPALQFTATRQEPAR